MAAKKSGKATERVQDFVKAQLEEARTRLMSFEEDAEAALKGVLARGQAQRKELEGLIEKMNSGDLKLLGTPDLKDLGKRASQAGAEVRKRLDELQSRVVEATGAATVAQLKELGKEVSRLTKRVETLSKTKKPRKGADA